MAMYSRLVEISINVENMEQKWNKNITIPGFSKPADEVYQICLE